jgi:formylglycine-generating enzyme required for sulfatase activity
MINHPLNSVVFAKETSMDFSRDRWECVSAHEREDSAKRLAAELPSGFSFESVRRFELGPSQSYVASYRFENSTFVLVPGGNVSIGFSADRLWEATAEEVDSWQETAEEYGIDKSIHEYVVAATLRRRQAGIAPFLVETVSREMGWKSVDVNDPEVRKIVKETRAEEQMTVIRGDVSTRVRREDDGSLVAERSRAQSHPEISTELKRAGFRFPTSDEWEYVCGCGSDTLYRWGDHVPCDRYPTDICPEEANWRRKWALSAGKLKYPPEGFKSDWDYHRRPNAFGIYIASDPYKYELVAEGGTTRGGDGGGMICGGAGFFVGWLTLATAYFEDHSCRHDPSDSITHGYTVGRRVLPLT